jgi:RNA polymerase sigma factor (sigma-70 family)
MAWPKSSKSASARAAAAEFETLMREHVPQLYKSAYRWTGAVDRAEDLVQDLLVRLYPMLDELRKLDRIRPWAMRVMYRIFVDQLRRERSAPLEYGADATGAEGELPQSEAVDPTAGPAELVELQLIRERISKAWQHLGEEHRVVLSMHDIEGYSLVEISAMTDVPLGTLKSRLHRARTRLRELLTERFSMFDRVRE